MNTRKHILFFARWYPDRYDPMLGLFVQKHAQAVHLYHNVSVVYVFADPALKPGTTETESVVFEGIREFRIYFGKHTSEWRNALEYLRQYLRGSALAEAKSGRIEIAHVHVLTRAAVPAFWLKITRGIPYLVTEHWSRYLPENMRKGSFKGKWRLLGTRFLLLHAYMLTTVTENLAQAMLRLGLRQRYIVIPNVADVHLFRPVDKPRREKKKLIHVSCFDEPAKNIRGLLRAVSEVAGRRTDFTIDIIGDGRDFHMVHEYALTTGLVDRVVFFRGLLTGEPLCSAMRDADALVMFSNYENLPCTIVESLCCGVPVISTRVGGIDEHVNATNGILIPAGDESALSIAMDRILDHPEAFDPTALSVYANGRFSMESVGMQFSDLYNLRIPDS